MGLGIEILPLWGPKNGLKNCSEGQGDLYPPRQIAVHIILHAFCPNTYSVGPKICFPDGPWLLDPYMCYPSWLGLRLGVSTISCMPILLSFLYIYCDSFIYYVQLILIVFIHLSLVHMSLAVSCPSEGPPPSRTPK